MVNESMTKEAKTYHNSLFNKRFWKNWTATKINSKWKKKKKKLKMD